MVGGYGCLLAGTIGPGVDQFDTAALVVNGVAGCHGSLMRAGDRGDLAVKLTDRAPRGATRSGDGGVGPGGSAIKRQDAIAEVFVEQASIAVVSALRRLPAGRVATPCRSSASPTVVK